MSQSKLGQRKLNIVNGVIQLNLSGEQVMKKQKIDKAEDVLITRTALDKYYWIRKPFSEREQAFLREKMTIAFEKIIFGSRKVTDYFRVFVENPNWFGVPRFFGLQRYGSPTHDKLTQGEPMNPQVQFEGTLFDTQPKPQIRAIQSWEDSDGCGVLVLPTGCGKTVCAIAAAVRKKRRTLILVHETGLLDQWKRRIHGFVPMAQVGVIQQKKCEIEGFDFSIATIQSLIRRDYPGLDTFGMVIVDEAHHLPAQTFCQSIMRCRPRYTLGLSATPERADGRSFLLYWLLGPIVFSTIRYDEKPMHIWQIEYRKEKGDEMVHVSSNFGRRALLISSLTEDEEKNQWIGFYVQQLFERVAVKKCLIISSRTKHLYELKAIVEDLGYSCGMYVGRMKTSQLLKSTTKQVILGDYGKAKEGLDVDGLNAIIFTTPTAKRDLTQFLGRQREKKDAQGHIIPRYVVDFIDSSFDQFHGMGWSRFQTYRRKFKYHVDRVQPGTMLPFNPWEELNKYMIPPLASIVSKYCC